MSKTDTPFEHGKKVFEEVVEEMTTAVGGWKDFIDVVNASGKTPLTMVFERWLEVQRNPVDDIRPFSECAAIAERLLKCKANPNVKIDDSPLLFRIMEGQRIEQEGAPPDIPVHCRRDGAHAGGIRGASGVCTHKRRPYSATLCAHQRTGQRYYAQGGALAAW
jgi:hypothetical protein